MSVENAPVPMDEVMLAMDVVDTLRHSARVVERELDADGQDQRLLERLKNIYASQGIEVPDYILREGVDALREDRFKYTPTPRTFSRRMAEFYVRNKQKFSWKFVLVAGVVGYLGYFLVYNIFLVTPEVRQQQMYVELAQTLPEDTRRLLDRIYKLTPHEQIQEQANVTAEAALSAIAVKDVKGALSEKERLEQMVKTLIQEYSLRIISGQGQTSAVWRVPDDNPDARNYYLLVEPVGSDGRVTSLEITNEENNKLTNVKKFGVRVSQDVFEGVRTDKEDDGIIQNNIVGTKARGEMDVQYNIPVMNGRITDW